MKKITSEVIKGLGIGKKLGYPTLNLAIPYSLKLKHGVYGCVVNVREVMLYGALYFGPRFDNDSGEKEGITLEIHILNPKKKITQFINNITLNQRISVTVGSFLRPPIKLLSKKNIKNQIKTDINKLTALYSLKSGDKLFLKKTI